MTDLAGLQRRWNVSIQQPAPDFDAASGTLILIGWFSSPSVNRVDVGLPVGIDRARDTLIENIAKGLPANNALLWGARGMGK